MTGERKNVLVGIRFDEYAKEVLDWAVFKVADAGDRVIAIHVCRNSDSPSKYAPLLDSYLADYEGLCDQKQVDLTGQVVKGNSIRRVLVREAKTYSAVAVIVGISKNKAFGGWLSIAKHCAKKLPQSTEVLAIHNGKVVFNSFPLKPGLMRDPKPSFSLFKKSVRRDNENEFSISEVSEMGRHSTEGIRSLKCEDFTPSGMHKKALSSVPLSIKELEQQRPGWPLMRTPSSLTPTSQEARKMSVVKWVMNLPSRSLPESPQSSRAGSSPKSLEDSPKIGSEKFLCKGDNLKDSKRNTLPEIIALLLKTNLSCCQWISHDVLKTATSQFSSENMIGNGGCNRVYKGILPDGKAVAVKILALSREAWKDYILEINIMTSLSHRSITPLVGICVEGNNLISVYHFMSGGNLEENLHGGKGKSALVWKVRWSVAIGIAEALDYLHKKSPRPVIHRDVKSSNILLSDEYEAQLSDFGLAIWGPIGSYFLNHGDVVGTFGYLAPEYFMYGKVSDKIDVYSFGVVLLELLTGKRPISLETKTSQESLVMWAKPKLEKGDLASLLDPSLDKDVDEEQIVRMALAANLCLTRAARLRPTMNQILKILQGEKDMDGTVNIEFEDQNDLDNSAVIDDEVYPESCAESHLELAFLDVEDNSISFDSSTDHSRSLSLEEYMKGRWSRSSSSLD